MNQAELIKPRVFKQILLSVIENANSDTIMRNMGFLLTNKFLEQVLNSSLANRSNYSATRNASTSFSRLTWQKKVNAYKSITFTLFRESDLFFASIKNQKWNQQ